MRLLLVAAAMLLSLTIAGCSNPGAAENSSRSVVPQQAPTVAPAATARATLVPTLSGSDATVAVSTPRGSSTRTPAPVPTRADGVPVPADARETKNIPDTLRAFLQTQLKGQHRIGQPVGYLVSRAPDQVMQQYQNDLQAQGWEAVPLVSNLPDNTKLIIAQKDVRAIIAFTLANTGDTLVYIVTTQR